ncbi:MAG: DNA repair exonuclease [Candidatus Mcinerneyibacterium aminivorans]|uniref:DNA repair exonuclease n=1 Tax=Candidatus Mcinerneyibacterium aminivorans TaxID=2703815 RepID=A0A5D0MJ99_9BACT|nr:MAG: DNA repair exonuclease [Candidatus Mcinerneyibacterium aminivorans]
MQIIHTADIHLKEYKDKRWEALETLISLCEKREIDYLFIAGDLFDKNISGSILQNNLRELFSDLSFDIFFIPGNHDITAIQEGDYFGDNLIPINSIENPVIKDKITIWGLPYQQNMTNEKILKQLEYVKENINKNKLNILLFHGELIDSFFSKEDYGNEEDTRYMPVRIDDFKDVGVDYILAGHFHTSYNIFEIEKESYFIYPGSPVSITKKELGKRRINYISSNEKPKPLKLNSFYYDFKKIDLDPYSEISPVDEIRKMIKEVEKDSNLIMEINGFFNGDKWNINEEEMVDFVNELLNKKNINYDSSDIKFNFKEISFILESDIFKKFIDLIDEKKYKKEKKDKLKKIMIKAMAGLKYEN